MKKFPVQGTVQGTKFLGFAIFGFAIFILTLLATSSTSFAHKVNIFAYVEGNQVYTESYFPDGRKVEGGTIEVYDSQENKLLSGTTDKEGKFNFIPPKKDNLKIVLIATMGHKNSYLLSAADLPGGSAPAEGAKNGSGTTEQGSSENSAPAGNEQAATAETQPSSSASAQPVQVDVQEIKKIIDQSLDRKLAPILRELAMAQQEKMSPTQIFGGIGYIFGIIGIILYFTKKKSS
jgi:nickel transport protein